MKDTVVALFRKYDEAERVVDTLLHDGVDRDAVSIMAADHHGGHEPGAGEEVASARAGSGALVGGAAGAILSVTALAVPGLGPILAAGPITGALTAFAGGLAAGGAIGALIGLGLDRDVAEYYASGVQRGGAIIAVKVAENERERVESRLRGMNAVDVGARFAEADRSRDRDGSRRQEDGYPRGAEHELRGTPEANSSTDTGRGALHQSPDGPQKIGKYETTYEARASNADLRPGVGSEIPDTRDAATHRTSATDEPGGAVRLSPGGAQEIGKYETTYEAKASNADVRPGVGREIPETRDPAAHETSATDEPGGVVRQSPGSPQEMARNQPGVTNSNARRDRGRETQLIAPDADTPRAIDPDPRVPESSGKTSSGPEHYAPPNEKFNSSFDEFAGVLRRGDLTFLAGRGELYESHREAFDFGGRLAEDAGFAGRPWATVEPELRAEWEREGQHDWANVRDSVRQGWESSRGTG